MRTHAGRESSVVGKTPTSARSVTNNSGVVRMRIPGKVGMLSASVTAGMCKPCAARFVAFKAFSLRGNRQTSGVGRHVRVPIGVDHPLAKYVSHGGKSGGSPAGELLGRASRVSLTSHVASWKVVSFKKTLADRSAREAYRPQQWETSSPLDQCTWHRV